MSLTSKLKSQGIGSFLPIVFYGLIGILFIVLLPFNNYPPHVGLTGVLSLIAAYGLFTRRFWAPWLVLGLVFVATVFALFTLYFTLVSDWLVSLGMVAYVVLAWLFAVYVLNKRKTFET